MPVQPRQQQLVLDGQPADQVTVGHMTVGVAGRQHFPDFQPPSRAAQDARPAWVTDAIDGIKPAELPQQANANKMSVSSHADLMDGLSHRSGHRRARQVNVIILSQMFAFAKACGTGRQAPFPVLTPNSNDHALS